MSEQQPLLSNNHAGPSDQDVESGSVGEPNEKGTIAVWKEKTAEKLESKPWHYLVILLARIFAHVQP